MQAIHLAALLFGMSVAAAGYMRGSSPRCGMDERPMMLAQLYFGRNIGSSPAVSDAELDSFVAQVVTPKFPQGLTRTPAVGEWKGGMEKAPVKESSEVVTIVVADTEKSRSDLESVRQAYMSLHRQDSVLLTRLSVCART